MATVQAEPCAPSWRRAMEECCLRLEARSGSWATYRETRLILRRFLRGHRDPGALRPLDVERWAYSIGPSGRKPSGSTVRNRLSALGAYYRHLLRADLVAVDPVRDVPRPVRQLPPPKGLTREEWLRLLAAVPTDERGLRDRAILVTLTITGLRRAELCALEVGSLAVRPDGRTLYTVRVKGGKVKRYELPAPVLEAIHAWRDAVGVPLQRLPEGSLLFGIGPAMVYHLVRAYGRLAGLQGVTPHVLRHTAAQLRDELGHTPGQIAQLLGHEDERYTGRYLARLRGEVDAGAGAVAAYLGL